MAKIKTRISDNERKPQNEKSKICTRKLKEKRKNKTALYEEQKRKERERYKARKEANKIKSIEDLSEGEKRNIRRKWRERSKRCYHAKKQREIMDRRLGENTPPSTPVFDQPAIDHATEII